MGGFGGIERFAAAEGEECGVSLGSRCFVREQAAASHPVPRNIGEYVGVSMPNDR